MIDMVAQLIFTCIYDFPVHTYAHWFASFARINTPDCVECPLAPQGTPFIPAKTQVIVRVHDCVQSPRKRYSPEGIAVANTPVQKNRKNQQPFNPGRDVNDNLNDRPLPPEAPEGSGEILNSKH